MGTNTVDADGTAGIDLDDAAVAETTGTGLEANVAGALAYLLGIVTGVIMFVVEPDDEFVRFHAAQSIATFGLLFVGYVALSVVGTMVSLVFFSAGTGGALVGGLLSLFLGLLWLVVSVGSLALWVYLMVRAYQGETPRVPVAAKLADRLV